MTAAIGSNDCFAPLFADSVVARLFSAETTEKHLLAFEVALTEALKATGAVPAEAADRALARMRDFTPKRDALGEGSLRDGLPVPEFVRQLKSHIGGAEALHIGATSQDLLDTSLAMTLRDLSDTLTTRMAIYDQALEELEARFGDAPLMGRTRMQAALPVTVSHRIAGWRAPLHEVRQTLDILRPRVERLQYAGPVGARTTPEGRADAVAEHMARTLSLVPSPSWHTNRQAVVDYGTWLSSLTGALGKMGQDIVLMAQQGVDEIKLAGGGASSAMPHKQNPVLAETLVTFARFNATQAAGLHHVLVHEQERSGTAWTLEWMILPPMAETAGKALTHALRLTGQIDGMGGN